MTKDFAMTPPPRTADAMDRAAGLNPAGEVFALRGQRPEYVTGAEACRTSVLAPEDDLGLAPPLRAAIARRVALSAGNDVLLAGYALPTTQRSQRWPPARRPPTRCSAPWPFMRT